MTEASVNTQSEEKPSLRRATCSNCGGPRNCDIRGSHDVNYDDEHMWGRTTWYILECRGCERVFVQTCSINSEDVDYYYEQDGSTGGTYNETLNYWPALSKRKRPDWMSEAGVDADNVDALDEALVELYGALDNDLHMLAAIGIRTTYDIASELLGIDSNLTFAKKLQALIDAGHIGKVDKDRIETMVDAGSASVHSGWRPNPNELETMMDILEHFIDEAFVAPARKAKLDAKAARVKKVVPPRNNAKGKATQPSQDQAVAPTTN
jgi:hypothetical protein